MKRSEAIERLRAVVKKVDDLGMPSVYGAAVYGLQTIQSARAVLDAEDDLPYEVYDANGELVGAFPYNGLAQEYIDCVYWHESREPLRIVGPESTTPAPDYDPDDVAFSDEFKAKISNARIAGENAVVVDFAELPGNPEHLPRLVEAEQERPTLDQMPEWERHLCLSPNGNQVWLMSINGYAWYAATPALSKTGHGRSEYTVLDAPPPQRTVRDLRPGDVVKLDGRWSVCSKSFAIVDLLDGAIRCPRSDTPIDKVCRFEVPSCD